MFCIKSLIQFFQERFPQKLHALSALESVLEPLHQNTLCLQKKNPFQLHALLPLINCTSSRLVSLEQLSPLHDEVTEPPAMLAKRQLGTLELSNLLKDSMQARWGEHLWWSPLVAEVERVQIAHCYGIALIATEAFQSSPFGKYEDLAFTAGSMVEAITLHYLGSHIAGEAKDVYLDVVRESLQSPPVGCLGQEMVVLCA